MNLCLVTCHTNEHIYSEILLFFIAYFYLQSASKGQTAQLPSEVCPKPIFLFVYPIVYPVHAIVRRSESTTHRG